MENLSEFLKQWNSPSDFIIAHTSGSTGAPKEIKLSKADMRASAHATNEFFGLHNNSRAALPLSLDYIAGKMMAVRAVEGGYPLDMLPVSNNIRLPENGCRYSLIPVVPSQLPSLIEHCEYSNRVENVLIGGARPDESLCRNLLGCGYKAFISYGMTETCSHVALADASDTDRIYHAMPGITFDTENDGRLIIEAPHFSFRRLVTNDIIELVDRHSFRWCGRFDNVINSGGIKLFAEQLEKLYAPILIDKDYYVVGRKHLKWGECVCLVIEEPADGKKIVDTLRSTLDHRLCPVIIEIVDVLPRTSNGKIIRK